MKLWKRACALLCALSLCAVPASAHEHPALQKNVRPRIISPWAQEEVARARELGLIPTDDLPDDYRLPITREQYRALSMEFVAAQERYETASLTGRGTLNSLVNMYLIGKVTDAASPLVFPDGSMHDSIAYYLGLMDGRSNGQFDPDGLVTRQEAAEMLLRAYCVCGGVLPEETAPLPFTDAAQIADGARESVAVLAGWGVITGRDDGRFLPEEPCSVEQCVLTFLRLYENAPVSRRNGNVKQLFTYEQCLGYIEALTAESSDGYMGFYHLVTRLDGPKATFIRVDVAGMSSSGTFLYILYPDGGMRSMDLGLCNDPGPQFLAPNHMTLESCRFSDDGTTFYCTVTIRRPTYYYVEPYRENSPDNILLHDAGTYDISVDVETLRYELTMRPQV